MSLIESICKNIYPLDTRFMEQAQARQDRLIKPQGSLGKLEEISIQLAGIYGSKYFDTTKKIVLSFACDHGVYEEGVAPNNQNITLLQSMNFPKKINGVGTISKFVGSDVQLVDVGINCDEPIEGVIDCKIRKSTSNMAKGPAMTRQEAIRAIEIGIEMSEKYIQEDYKVIGIGEMGIANTTPSAAIISVIAGCDPQEVTGMGAGLKKELLAHKAQVIRTAIEINQPNPTDGIDILQKVGGFEIGSMAGVILGCSANRVPVVLDGFISYAAALIAVNINPRCKDYMIASHYSAEPGAKKALELLGLDPFLKMDMRLGEGSGAALAFNMIEAANYVYKNMLTFDEVDMGM
ncbi:MAG: nicotinate-nucleotide--dimethylbenzimidazole phosphoribosyltransferase [Clostridiales bacterium]|jgi:nicotinate-nucleotide--dimethylbenzimidazole phosphoribosyltransferase|uniref:nicotinate-nucleotide--dimethylbenzimidazole phosphoribosyltransferase n=1 Tax=Clostridia TaxID=186801 RepID=UPI0018AC1DA2|nr:MULTISPECIES: nicotinate-nucleotide--dimethylbenzimidazole phosphoribosyltransferase [Clostridia]MDU1201822.1 nicotinate-nucleotide--dimethylbenzimidazole phosphoribosyltransferase [Clostridiales bacterium]MDY5212068.1 nicotinate-nucleotide--dimethylbenzimidazole phosphoribosyltransferase [Intestinibacter sp.]